VTACHLFFPKLSDTEKRFIPDWLIIGKVTTLNPILLQKCNHRDRLIHAISERIKHVGFRKKASHVNLSFN
jgi:hypothetical protein